MNNTTLGVIAIVIGLIAVAIGGYAIVYNKGETGDIGPQGLPGAVGSTGLQGPQGEKGDKGDTGDTGLTGATGSRGPRGLPGEDGIDLEPNEAPIIDVNDSDSYVEGCGWSDDYRYYLNITLNDLEEDLMKVYLYTRWSNTSDWEYQNSWPMIANGTYLNYHKESSGNGDWGNRTLYWLVECMDGENLVYLEGDTTLNKVVCP